MSYKHSAILKIAILFVVTSVTLFTLQPVMAAKEEMSTVAYRVLPLLEKLNSLAELDVIKSADRFPDAKRHWARTSIGKLTALDIINGMPDGTFKPDSAVKVDEFIAMTVRTLGYKIEAGDKYWAEPFIQTVIEQNIISENEFTDYRRAITREEMAKITVLAVLLKEPAPSAESDRLVGINIRDYVSIGDKYKQHVITAYIMGLLNGSPDGSFNPQKTLTRAEASTVILKNLSIKDRTPFKPEDGHAIELTDGNGKSYVICKPDKKEEIKTAYVVKNNAAKSKGYVRLIYNPQTDLIGNTYYLSEKRYKENNYDIHMSFSIKTNANSDHPYNLSVEQPDKVKELHQGLVMEIFKFLFENDSNKAIVQFDKYIDMGIQRSSAKEEVFNFNGRKVIIYKLDGDTAFTIWIYAKAS